MKLNYPKEWYEKSALIEDDDEIGAGAPPALSKATTSERMHVIFRNGRWAVKKEGASPFSAFRTKSNSRQS